jgi:hypothetical protein
MRKVVRDRILKRDGHKCARCGSCTYLEIDHIQPLSRGGRHDETNMQVLCRTCNRKKGSQCDWSRYFIMSKSPDYLLVSRRFGDVLKELSPKETVKVVEWALAEHRRLWGLEK